MKRVLFASAVTIAALLPATPAGADSLAWTRCGVDAECTAVTVPIDWARPDGPSFDLEVTRRKATQPSKGVLFYGEGGPGGPSATVLKENSHGGPRSDFDLIGVNARGMGGAYPILCPTPKGPQNDLPSSPEELAKLKADNAAYAAECRKLTGPLYDHLDTASNARDLEAVRAALGVPKIYFYGRSYGTLLGQQYAELFPQRIERMVLDSTMDHSVPDGAAFAAAEARGLEVHFDNFGEWCAQTEECALHGRDVHAVLRDVQKRAEAGEIKDVFGEPLNALTVDALASEVVFDWKGGSRTLKELADDGISGYGNEYISASETLTSVLCQDWNMQLRDFAEYQDLVHRVAQAAPMTRFSTFPRYVLACQGWPIANINPPKPLPGKSTVPALVLSSRYDLATVHPWAQNLSTQAGWGLLTYDGSRHITYEVPCMKGHADRFLATGELPAPGTVCAQLQDQRQEPQRVHTFTSEG
ncbi:alpha/beta fold hydrolase [Pseudonocardiaceae bacterium YIM PH 21723]|nr:alpha/beta fold hydrolase [Pseudonocardiaceae bacterium YIM PH 21723]